MPSSNDLPPVFTLVPLAPAMNVPALLDLLEDVKARAYGGVVLPLPLGDERAWEIVRTALHWCRELRLKAWLQIEYSKVGAPYLHPEMWDLEAGAVPLAEGPPMSMTLVPRNSLNQLDWSRAQTRTKRNTSAQPLDFDARIYSWILEHDSTRAFDPLSHEAVEGALSSTRLAWQSVALPMRDVVQGISLEVPPLWSADAPDATRRFPWSPTLAQRFQELHGYEIDEHLSSLVADTGQNAVRVRQHFQQTIATLLRENLVQPFDKWAREEAQTILQWRFAAAGLNHLVARYGDITAVARDAKNIVVEVEASGGKQSAQNSSSTVLVRLLASLQALHQALHNETSNELAGEAPGRTSGAALAAMSDKVAEETANRVAVHFPDAARLFEWHRFLLAGATRFEVDWNLAATKGRSRVLHLYIARQVMALHMGRTGARVGVLWPMRSAWAHHHSKGHRFVRWVEEDVALVADWLDDLHFDWIFLPEDDLTNAPIEDRVLDVRQSTRLTSLLLCGAAQLPLETIVLPSVTCLSRAAWAKLEEFAERGGKIVCLGLLPRWSEQGRDTEQELRIEKQTRCTLEDVYAAYKREGAAQSPEESLAPSSVGYPILRQTAAGGRISTYQPRLNDDRADARLRVRPMMSESLAPDLETQTPDIRYTRRKGSAGDLFWVWNARGETQKCNLLLRPGQVQAVEESDAWRGSSTRLAVWMPLPRDEGGGLALAGDMAANETRLFQIDTLTGEEADQSIVPHGESANFAVESFDGEIARGWARQSGVPMFAVRENGRMKWWRGEAVTVPSPILLDEWEAQPMQGDLGEAPVEYSQNVRLPAAWRGYRLRLEVAVSSPGNAENGVQAWANEQPLGQRFALPLGFDLPASAAPQEIGADGEDAGAPLHIVVQVEWPNEQAVGEAPLARLVAYPTVEIRRPS